MKLFAAAALALALVSTAASAQGPLAACATDAQTLCANQEKGEGGRVRCLRENEAKLSPDCKAAITKIREAREAVRNACKTDADTLCKEAAAKDGERGGNLRCLRDNAAKVSKPCADALAGLPNWGAGRAGEAQKN